MEGVVLILTFFFFNYNLFKLKRNKFNWIISILFLKIKLFTSQLLFRFKINIRIYPNENRFLGEILYAKILEKEK
jgi:hypothetical protein